MGARRVLVTGASGDLGRALAERFYADGAALALHCYRRASVLDPLLERARRDGREVHVLPENLLDPDGPLRLAKAVANLWPGLDALVNNAGGGRARPLTELEPAEWHESLQLNLTAPYLLIQALLPLLEAAGGAVVNVSSVAALTGGAFGPHYAAAKAGVIGLTRSAARELGPRGIRVNAVAPGPVVSAMTDSLPEPVRTRLAGETSLGRFVTPADIAETVKYLASTTSTNGQTLVVDAGRHMH